MLSLAGFAVFSKGGAAEDGTQGLAQNRQGLSTLNAYPSRCFVVGCANSWASVKQTRLHPSSIVSTLYLWGVTGVHSDSRIF